MGIACEWMLVARLSSLYQMLLMITGRTYIGAHLAVIMYSKGRLFSTHYWTSRASIDFPHQPRIQSLLDSFSSIVRFSCCQGLRAGVSQPNSNDKLMLIAQIMKKSMTWPRCWVGLETLCISLCAISFTYQSGPKAHRSSGC